MTEALHEVREDLAVLKTRLGAYELILSEMKDVAKAQNKTIIEIVRLQEKQQRFEQDYLNLRKDFEKKNKDDEPILTEIRSFMAKWTGVMSAAAFVFVMIQGLCVYIWNQNNDSINSRIDKIESVVPSERVVK